MKICDEIDRAWQLHDYFKNQLSQEICWIISQLEDLEGEIFLQSYIKGWDNYTLLANKMRLLFKYLVSYEYSSVFSNTT